jgi:dCMP deaminase
MAQNDLRRLSPVPVVDALLHMCDYWSKARSKDPNTQVGACVYNWTTGDMYFGYNGFAPGFSDLEVRWEKPAKYEYVIHAEENAIRKAVSSTGTLSPSCVLICTHKPCVRCMMRIAAHGIRRVIYRDAHDDSQTTSLIALELNVSLEQYTKGASIP